MGPWASPFMGWQNAFDGNPMTQAMTRPDDSSPDKFIVEFGMELDVTKVVIVNGGGPNGDQRKSFFISWPVSGLYRNLATESLTEHLLRCDIKEFLPAPVCPVEKITLWTRDP